MAADQPAADDCDQMRQAMGALVASRIMHNDYVGAQHAGDLVFQLAHAGANMHLMEAYQMLGRGDKMGAIQQLAAAHAFFPDEVTGEFNLDTSGDIWAQRLDENNPPHPLGPAFQVTPDRVAALFNQTTDPHRFIQTAIAQRRAAARMHREAVYPSRFVFTVRSPPQRRC
jgi:hypothetical protein